MTDSLGIAYAVAAMAAAAGYFCGSIPFGLLLTRLAGFENLRQTGSGNIGATNVLRAAGKPLALATLVLDSAKGGAVTALALEIWGFEAALIAGFAAVVGHNFPIWLRFRGGKGVATTLGVLLVCAWPVGLAACASWALVAAVFRYSSLAALVALVAAPGYALMLDAPGLAFMAAGLALLAVGRHRQNIIRLIRGTESRIGGGGGGGSPGAV
jgi:glycerol-3-phosphate acyltransferase PlsY